MTRAGMARSGLREGSEAWNLNLQNMRKQQQKERKTLQYGATATELQGEIRKKYGYAFKRPELARQFSEPIDYGREATYSHQQDLREIEKRVNRMARIEEDRGGRLSHADIAKTRTNLQAKLPSMKDRITSMKEQDAADYEAGKFFEPGTTALGGVDFTRAGRQRVGELMRGEDNRFGRQMKMWEALAEVTYGGEQKGLSAAEQSAVQASKAASGNRGRASAVEAEAAAASPWVTQQSAAFQ